MADPLVDHIFTFAKGHARNSGHDLVGTGHLLLALFHRCSKYLGGIRKSFYLSPIHLQAALYEILPPSSHRIPAAVDIIESPNFYRTRQHAEQLALLTGDTEFIILETLSVVLMKEQSTAGAMLKKLGISRDKMLTELRNHMTKKETQPMETVSYTTDMSGNLMGSLTVAPPGAEININPLPEPDAIRHAASLLRGLAMDIASLRYYAAIRHIQTSLNKLDKEQESQYFHTVKALAKEEANDLRKAADALDGTLQQQQPARRYISCDAKPVATMTGIPSDVLSLEASPKETVEECPQGHHKLEGECRFDYCRCVCARCKEQCERHR